MSDRQARFEARQATLSANGKKLFSEFDALLADILTVKNEALPEQFRNRVSADETTTMESLVKKTSPKVMSKSEQRAVSVKFETVNGERVITESTPERLAAIEAYAAQVAAGNEELNFDADEHRLYRAQMTFATVMVKAGILSEEDFEDVE